MASFLTLQQELGAQLGLDQTVADQATLLKRWINNAQQIILRSFEWPFNRSSTPLVVQTVADVTGTASINAGSTTFTDSSFSITSAMVGRYVQFSGNSDWYRITSLGAPNFPVIEAAYTGTTSSASAYTVRKFYYTTSSAVDRIVQITQSILPYQLIETTEEYFQTFNPGFLASGTPRVYCTAGTDSSGYPQFRLWPNPDAVINLSVTYLKTATDMSADADVSVIPAKWHTTTLLEGAKAQGYSFLDDARYANSVALFRDEIDEMKTEYETGLHRHRVMTAADNQPVGGNLGYMPLPFNYPRSS
jgi:hypothetical protein